MTGELERRMARIEGRMRDRGALAVAFSGGLDSSVTAALAVRALGDRAVALLLDSETLPRRELECARRVAGEIGIRLVELSHSELSSPDVRANRPDRCYHCRKEMVRVMKEAARVEEAGVLADGVLASDAGEHRPGIRAADEAGVWHPLSQEGLTKEDVRAMARLLGLSVSAKPSQACLSSRIPYGRTIDAGELSQVERGEEMLLGMGFSQVRVRHHGDLARVEVPAAELGRLMRGDMRRRVVKGLTELGFCYVAVDLRGYRSGAMDEALSVEQKAAAARGVGGERMVGCGDDTAGGDDAAGGDDTIGGDDTTGGDDAAGGDDTIGGDDTTGGDDAAGGEGPAEGAGDATVRPAGGGGT